MSAWDKTMLRLLAGSLSNYDLTTVNWQQVLTSENHRFALPHLFKVIKSQGIAGNVPPAVHDWLGRIYMQNAARNIRRSHELSKRLRVLADAAIPVIVLKGAHLAELVYRDIGLRAMGDVDLLLRPADYNRAQEVLRSAGFDVLDPGLPLDLHFDTSLSAVGIHIDIDGLWQRSRPASFGNAPARVLCPEDLIIHLATNASLHHFFSVGLRNLLDIREVVKRYQGELNWRLLIGIATGDGLANAVGLALTLARELLNAGIPEWAVRELVPGGIPDHARRWAISRMFHTDGNSQKVLSPNLYLLFNSAGWAEMLRAFGRLLFPNPGFFAMNHAVPLGSSKNLLLYWSRFRQRWRDYARLAGSLLQTGPDGASQRAELRSFGSALAWLKGSQP